MIGRVKNVNCARGFMFLESSELAQDAFCHVRDVIDVDNLTESMRWQQVDFEVEETPRGPKAVRVRFVTDWGDA